MVTVSGNSNPTNPTTINSGELTDKDKNPENIDGGIKRFVYATFYCIAYLNSNFYVRLRMA